MAPEVFITRVQPESENVGLGCCRVCPCVPNRKMPFADVCRHRENLPRGWTAGVCPRAWRRVPVVCAVCAAGPFCKAKIKLLGTTSLGGSSFAATLKEHKGTLFIYNAFYIYTSMMVHLGNVELRSDSA